MKKKSLYLLVILCLAAYPCSEISAQSFLKKIAQGLENVNKELDKVSDALSGAQPVTIHGTEASYLSDNRLMKVELRGAEMRGNNLYIDFVLTNLSGSDIRSYELANDINKKSANTYAVDNLGNRAAVEIFPGGEEKSMFKNVFRKMMPAGLPLSATAVLRDVNPKASSFTQINIFGYDRNAGSQNKELQANFIFKNIPVVRLEQIQETELVQETPDHTPADNQPVSSSVPSVNIFETKLGVPNWSDSERNRYQKGARLTQQERLALKIDEINGDVLNKSLANNDLVKGKTIYQGQNGRIETLVYIFEELGSYEPREYVISYDANGNYIDHLKVGHDPMYAGMDVTTTIKGDAIRIKTYMHEDMDYPAETTYQTYQILSNLKFKKVD